MHSNAGRQQWTIGVPILTHPLMLIGIAKVFAVAGFLMWSLVAFIFLMQGDWRLIGQLGLVMSLIVAGLFVFVILAASVVYRNRIHFRFTVDDEAATAESIGSRATMVGKLATFLGVVTGKAQAAGAGLLAEANSVTRVAWSSVASVRPYPRCTSIALGNGWRTTLILFCRPDNYDAVLAHVMAACAANPPNVRANPVPRLLLRSAMVSIACVPLFILPFRLDQFVPFLTFCFALASVWLIPLLAWAVLAGLAWIGFEAIVAMSSPYRSFVTHQTIRTYESLSGNDLALLAAALLGAVYLIWLSIALLRGRILSGLAGDLMEMEDVRR